MDPSNEQVATIKYTYDATTLNGYMWSGDIKTPIRVIPDCKESLKTCLSLNHENQIVYKFWDSQNRLMVSERAEKTLVDYLSGLNKVESFTPSIRYLTPKFRQVLRQILAYVIFLNDKGLLIEKFTKGNLEMVGDTLKFVGVGAYKPVTLKTYASIASSSVGSPKKFVSSGERKMNMLYVSDVFLDLLPLSGSPEEYNDLINGFRRDYIGQNETHSMKYHLSIMSPESILRFFCNIGSGNDLRNEDMLKQIVIATRVHIFGNHQRWNTKLDKAGLQVLKDFVVHAKIPYIFEHKADEEVTISFLRCCRNMSVHLKVPPSPSNKPEKKEEDLVIKLQVFILKAFTKEMCKLQYELCRDSSPHLWFE